MDKSYVDEQTQFIQSLTEREKFILKSYTSLGYWFVTRFKPTPELLESGMSMVKKMIENEKAGLAVYNMFYPKKLTDIKASDLPELVNAYATELSNIFQKSPKLKNPIKLYRGLRDTKFDASKEGIIVSTTYRTDWSGFLYFLGEECCMLELTVYPGVQTILIPSELSALSTYGVNQYEVIFMSNNVIMKCDDKEIRKQKIKFKNISVFECSVLPKDYQPSMPLKGQVPRLGGKTRKHRKLRKSSKSKNQRARR